LPVDVEEEIETRKRLSGKSEATGPWAKRGRLSGDADPTSEAVASRKHPRDGEAEEEMLMEEQIVRGAASEARSVALVTTVGPPWLDEYTGEELPTDLVARGMNVEMEAMDHFGVYEWVKEEEANDLIGSRWLLKRRPHDVKCRLVAQQVNYGKPMDTFAATPTSAAQRLVMFMAQHMSWDLQLGDVGTAFLHAPLPDTPAVYLRPPPGLRRPGYVWRLHKALYGLRQAPRYFQSF
jgi:hypothetical protein